MSCAFFRDMCGQTFMATIDVPQKKNGDMSNRSAASCFSADVSTSPPATMIFLLPFRYDMWTREVGHTQ